MIAVIDYKMGNIGSLTNALDYLGLDWILTNEVDIIRSASKIILPGVGAFEDAMKQLKKNQLIEIIKESYLINKPILGICLGFQILFQNSMENGLHEGLGLLEGSIERMNEVNLKVPHVGWNNLELNPECPLFEGVQDNSFVYFVHSYCLYETRKELIASKTSYGKNFISGVYSNKLFGLQFHPEKSGLVGLQILKNFGRLT